MIIRPKIQEIVDNIDKFEYYFDYILDYKDVRIKKEGFLFPKYSLSTYSIEPNRFNRSFEKIISLSKEEHKIIKELFKNRFPVAEKEYYEEARNENKKEQEDLLNSIDFNENRIN